MHSFNENKNELTFNAEFTNNQFKNSFEKIKDSNILSMKSELSQSNNLIPFSKTKKEVQNFVNIICNQTEMHLSFKNPTEK